MKTKNHFTKLIFLSIITFFANLSYAQTNLPMPPNLPNNLPSNVDSGPFIPFQPPAGLPNIEVPKMQPMPQTIDYNGFMNLDGKIYVIFNHKSYNLKDSFSIDGKEWTIDKYTEKHIILKHKKEIKKFSFQP